MPSQERIRLPARTAAAMVWNYARARLLAQVKSVAFIVVYLLLFQMAIAGITLAEAANVATGAGLVVLGLADVALFLCPSASPFG